MRKTTSKIIARGRHRLGAVRFFVPNGRNQKIQKKFTTSLISSVIKCTKIATKAQSRMCKTATKGAFHRQRLEANDIIIVGQRQKREEEYMYYLTRLMTNPMKVRRK